VADEALKVDPKSTEALNNKAVAEYLFGRKNNAENPNSLATSKTISAITGDAPHADQVTGAEGVLSRNRPSENSGYIGAGLTIDPYNFSFGPSIVWWPTEYAGCQASYGQGTFTTYAVRGLVRYGKIVGMTPYAGLGVLVVEREAMLLGVDTKFSGRGGEITAGVILPLSNRLSLLTAVTANAIKLEKTVYPNGLGVPLTMDYSPISVTVTLVY
jgi:hypothetical protein